MVGTVTTTPMNKLGVIPAQVIKPTSYLSSPPLYITKREISHIANLLLAGA